MATIENPTELKVEHLLIEQVNMRMALRAIGKYPPEIDDN